MLDGLTLCGVAAAVGRIGSAACQGVYHRDIAPGNILITKDGRLVLIDFGAARQMVSEKSHTVIESPGCTPFEQLQSRGNVGPCSGLYGLAATFYRALIFENPPKANYSVKSFPRSPADERLGRGIVKSKSYDYSKPNIIQSESVRQRIRQGNHLSGKIVFSLPR